MAPKSVYIMESNGNYKIGVAMDAEKRLCDLSIGNCDIRLIFVSEKLSNAHAVESQLHKALSHRSIGREWFCREDGDSLVNTVARTVQARGKTCAGDVRHITAVPEMRVKEDGVVYSLSDWAKKTKAETDKMAKENKELQELVYALKWGLISPQQINGLEL